MVERSERIDYVIVGAGSAGCVLANRLSATGARVLVLEAGKRDRSWLIHVPLGVGRAWHAPRFNWSYMSDPEPNLGGREIFHPRGKVVGGSSSINMMAYVRGHRGDYDRWRQMGLHGWSYADVLPYFRRAETFEYPNDGPYRGDTGPLSIQVSKTDDPMIDIFLAAVRSAGYSLTEDYNGATQEGFGRLQVNVAHGRRCSAAAAYLHPAVVAGRVGLETGALATSLVIQNGRVHGVRYLKNGVLRTVRAEREVILSGGAINSPHVLMLSGIGHGEHLAEHDIDTVVDLPGVGANLQDHPSIGVDYLYAGASRFHEMLRLDRLAFNMVRAHWFGSGPASIPPSSATGFVRSRPEAALPDIQLFFRPASFSAREWFPLLKPSPPRTFTFRACHLRPESRGRLRLRSSDPTDKIRIRNDFLSTETDRRVLRDAFRLIRKIAGQPEFAEVGGAEFHPGADIESDDQIDAFVRENLMTVYHPAGTCRMGVDDESVVDLEFRVRGIENLRVVDASVMPDLVGGNINAVVIMIAEKAADTILGRAPLLRAEI